MNIKDKAREFAIKAHMGQIRKSEPDKPKIIHPIGVAKMLESFGYDDDVVAAGYLHDVVEDTKYTNEDIEREFGSDIASLVMDASEPDKSLSWEERKEHTIRETKKLPFRNKLVVCADKINNLEDLYLKFKKSGKRDFSAFKRGEESQKWYYTNVYESLVYNEDAETPIFKRFKNVVDNMFNSKNEYTEENMLDAWKEETKRLKELAALEEDVTIYVSSDEVKDKLDVLLKDVDSLIIVNKNDEDVNFVDSDGVSIYGVAINVMKTLRSKYIDAFKKKYNVD